MLRGSIVALVTPMLASGDIDWTSLAALVEYHVGAGTSAIVAVGTTGESVTLSESEHIAVVEKTVEFAAGRIPLDVVKARAAVDAEIGVPQMAA